jgi:hypothetical protein
MAPIYKFVGTSVPPSTHVSDPAVITAFSLGGLVLAFIIMHFGLDYGAGIPG